MDCFRSITVIGPAYSQSPGEVPNVHCIVSRELRTDSKQTWTTVSGGPPPYLSGPKDLVVAFSASAAAGCLWELGWPAPVNVLDLRVVFSKLRNNYTYNPPASLFEAFDFFKIPHLHCSVKDFCRSQISPGMPVSPAMILELLKYSGSEVEGMVKLFLAIQPHISWPHDLLASRYTAGAVATMERAGVPVDVSLLRRITRSLPEIKNELRRAVNAITPVYGQGGEFSLGLFDAELRRKQVPWPRSDNGTPRTDKETFKMGALRFPELALALETELLLGKMQKFDLAIGRDGRNRVDPRPFATKTGRNAAGSASIFSHGRWLRNVIRPPLGYELVVLDYAQQEFHLAAALSGDKRMMEACLTGDFYMALAQSSGEIDSLVQCEIREKIRDIFKTTSLGIQYGISAAGLAPQVGGAVNAENLIRNHQKSFPRFWAWTRSVKQHVSLNKAVLVSPFGWSIFRHPAASFNVRSAVNFLPQAAGADMMRIASIALVERDIPLVWTMHDGFLLVCPERHVEQMVADSVRLLEESSAVVTGGHTCRVGVRRFGVNQPFHDEKGRPMFDKIMGYLAQIEGRAA